MVLALAACHSKNPAKKSVAVSVKTGKIELKEYAVPVISSGIVRSGKEARLSFKTGGIVSHMYAEAGQLVHKGQVLATLNMTEINANVGQLQTLHEKARRDFVRAGKLLADSATTRQNWENAQSALRLANESLKIASFNKEFSVIYATQNGTILQKLSNEGEMAAPGTTVYVISSTKASDWVLRIGVSDKDWARLRLKDKAVITLDAYPGQTFSGAVTKIEQAADPGSGTFVIELNIQPGNKKFATGLIGKVQITPSISEQVRLVPIEALHEADGQTGNVFSLSPDKKTVAIHRVQIAYILKDKVAISWGLENIHEVITQGVSYLSDKMPVNVQY